MPEGDTIHRSAARLHAALAGESIVRFEAARLARPGPAAGTVVLAVRAVGKYLFVDFSDRTSLETHMKMSGSWHLYRRGERWRRSPGAARAVIETAGTWVAVCFAAPHVRLVATTAATADHLGPDLTGEDPDLDVAIDRFEWRGLDAPLVDVLLDQRICCGVGNVYKSEVLHACRLHPSLSVSAIDAGARRSLVETAHQMLRRNLDGGPRRTVDRGPTALAVYGRAGRPCGRCGTPIETARLGRHARTTYWCPTCQPG